MTFDELVQFSSSAEISGSDLVAVRDVSETVLQRYTKGATVDQLKAAVAPTITISGDGYGSGVGNIPLVVTGLNGVSLAGLATGLLKNSTLTGVPSIAVAGVDYETPLSFSAGLTRTVNSVSVNTTQNIAKLSNLTSNGFVKTGAGDGTLSIDANTYLTGNQTITLSGDLSGSGATSIAATIVAGSVGLAKMASLAANSFIGNNTGLSATPIALTVSQSRSLLSIDNVENTALSTWAGSTSIVTLGTVSTGVWSGTAVGVTKGGTGLTTIAIGKLLYASALNTLAALSLGNSVAITTGTLDTIQDIRTSASPTFVTVTAALVGNASTATSLATGRTISTTGDVAYTSAAFDGSTNVTGVATLATVATAGTTGSSTAIPVITIDAKGRTTGITTAVVIAPAGTLTGSTLASGVIASSLTSFGASPTISGGAHTGITSLGIRDTSAAFDLTLAATSSTALTAGRTLTLDVVNAARTLKLTGNPTLADWFDQSVKSGASPTFVTVTAALSGNATTATTLATARTIGGSNFDGSANVTSFPSPGAIGGITPAAGTFTALTGTSGSITGLSNLAIRDTSAAFDVTLAATSSTTLTAGRTLTLDVANAARTLKLTGNPTLADWFDQSVKTTASPVFAGGSVTGAGTTNWDVISGGTSQQAYIRLIGRTSVPADYIWYLVSSGGVASNKFQIKNNVATEVFGLSTSGDLTLSGSDLKLQGVNPFVTADTGSTTLGFRIWNGASYTTFMAGTTAGLAVTGVFSTTALATLAVGMKVTTNGSSPGDASFYCNSTTGATMQAKTGSSYDFAITNPGNNVYLLRNPTGTQNWEILGSLSTADPTNGSGAWKLGKVRTSVGITASTTSVLEVMVDGTRYDLLVSSSLI